MNRTAFVRALLASAAIAAAVALASCETDGNSGMTRAMKPLSPEMVAALEQKHMPKESPILVRIFKEESEFEVWKQDESGLFGLLKTYPICRWSGDLGPKIKEGDRQAPEGYYTITPGQMNPNSSYYLSFNLGFPNEYDKANDRTGQFLMVHGDCSSAGCYAMTDEQMGEIYALGRDSFFGGQREFQVQAYPFRMTPLNMARHRDSPHMAFWRMIKDGYDHFEVSRREPKVDVCDKRYVFDAEPAPGSTFNPRGRCPTYVVQADIAAAAKQKRDNDEREFVALVSRGTPTVVGRGGVDGGMNPAFAARFKPAEGVLDNDGRVHTYTTASTPATIPATVNPPRAPEANSASQSTDNPFERMTSTVSKWVGLQRSAEPPPPEPAATPVVLPRPKAKPAAPVQTAAAIRPPVRQEPPQHQQSSSQQPPSRQQQPVPTPVSNPQPQTFDTQASAPAPPNSPASSSSPGGTNLMMGAQPMVPTTTFDGRWSGVH